MLIVRVGSDKFISWCYSKKNNKETIMKKQLSDKPRIAGLLMGMTLSATINAQDLLCGIIDGEGPNDAVAILQVDRLGKARGALCNLDLASATTLDNCHPVTGTVTGVTQIKIGLHGEDLGEDGQVNTNTGAFTYTPTGTYQGNGGSGSIASNPDSGAVTGTSVQGTATVVRCKATKVSGKIEPQYKIQFAHTSSQINIGVAPSLNCPSDTADTFRGPNNPNQLNGTSYAPGRGGNGGSGY